jgi:tRNA uridine 5-carboxymethylaminomethyl modification enzyme
MEDIARFKKSEDVLLPDDLDYSDMPGLSAEVVEKMSQIKPRSLGQASRISGVTPASISMMMIYLRKKGLL